MIFIVVQIFIGVNIWNMRGWGAHLPLLLKVEGYHIVFPILFPRALTYSIMATCLIPLLIDSILTIADLHEIKLKYDGNGHLMD